jgi:multicomponent Na+:H+ antiporter subunit E
MYHLIYAHFLFNKRINREDLFLIFVYCMVKYSQRRIEDLKKIISLFIVTLIFTVIYTILTESYTLSSFLLGLVISAVAVIITDQFLCEGGYVSPSKINIFKLFIYFGYLLFIIIKSGIRAIKFTIIGEVDVHFFTFHTKLSSAFTQNILANSITLTPGTVTINKHQDNLFIMQMGKKGHTKSLTDIKKMEDKLFRL